MSRRCVCEVCVHVWWLHECGFLWEFPNSLPKAGCQVAFPWLVIIRTQMKLPCLLAVVASRVVVAAVIVIVVVAVAVAVAAQGLDRTTGNEQQLDKLTCCLLHICLHSLFPPTSLYQCTLSSASLCVSPPSSLSLPSISFSHSPSLCFQ